jgi:glycosyltransferase involved in cell wall biosynthesis
VPEARRLHVVFWGTYDTGKPRARILLKGLRENGVQVTECHTEVWGGVEDKSQVSGLGAKLRLGLRWLLAYPGLVWRYLRLPRHDAVLVGYLGQLDVLVLWPFARLRRVPIVWDAFLSLYDTVVDDRRLVGRRNPLALALYAWEWLACRAADSVVLDTAAHGRYFVETFGLPPDKVHRVFVGAETDVFRLADATGTARDAAAPFTVLFYGQFIPLHGIETVVRAAKLTEPEGVRWQLIGTGQEAPRIRALIDELRPANLEWETWVPYAELLQRIHAADVCLGVFGASAKAARVIPNKVFQILASGRPVITADTPAARELLEPGPGVSLVPLADAGALAAAVLRMRHELEAVQTQDLGRMRARIGPRAVARDLETVLLGLGPARATVTAP